MADFGSIDGRAETPGDGAGRLSASELRPVDAAGREWPETTEEGLMADLDVVEREAREAREEAARLRARVAALEAALAFPTTARCAGHDGSPHPERSTHTVADCVHTGCDCRCSSRAWDARQSVMRGGTSALDAVVSAAVAAERKRADRESASAAREHQCGNCHAKLSWRFNGGSPAWFVIETPESPGPAVVDALDEERARIRARVEDLDTTPGTVEGVLHSDYRPHLIPVVRVVLDDVLSAIDATEGGAP